MGYNTALEIDIGIIQILLFWIILEIRWLRKLK